VTLPILPILADTLAAGPLVRGLPRLPAMNVRSFEYRLGRWNIWDRMGAKVFRSALENSFSAWDLISVNPGFMRSPPDRH
jgi:hypothetical protein